MVRLGSGYLGSTTVSRPAQRRRFEWRPALRPLFALICGLLFIWSSACKADGLPQGSGKIGELRRDPDGHLVTAPFAPPPPASPEPSPNPEKAPSPLKAPNSGHNKLPSASETTTTRKVSLARPPSCPTEAITCVEVIQVGRKFPYQPITFGQPFRRGDVPKGASLRAIDSNGQNLPLQVDQPATHPDGSLRFAVLSTEIPNLEVGEHRSVSLQLGVPSVEPKPTAYSPSIHNLNMDLNAYMPQLVLLLFGNRKDYTPGVPFALGETVTIRLDGTTSERYSVTIDQSTAGGGFETLTKLSEIFAEQISNRSQTYRAYKIGEGGGYEKLWITTREGHHQDFNINIEYTGNAKIAIITLQAFVTYQHYIGTIRSQGANTIKSTWLNGPIAVEQDNLVHLIGDKSKLSHPHLTARIHWRNYRRSLASRLDVIIENDWAYEPGPQNWYYDISIRRDGMEVFARSGIKHFHHARWHTVVWSEGRNEPEVRHNIEYMLRSGAVPHYDETLSVPEKTVNDQTKKFAKYDTGPMGTAEIATYMPMTGGRPDIGPLPTWAALYLVTMEPRLKFILLANADAGAGMPIHYRDKIHDLPINLDDHPGVALVYGNSTTKDALPVLGPSDTPWTPEVSHHPSLFYVPYLLTGDLFYLEEQHFWASWILGAVDPNYRGYAQGLIHSNQVRGQAWSLRTLGEASTITPDSHPLKTYFISKLNNNINWYLRNWVRNTNPAEISALGLTERKDVPGTMAPWQHDFLFLAVGHLTEMEVPSADEFAHWLGRFSVGRWVNEAKGFCRMAAPAYYINVRRKADNSWIDNWAELYQVNWPTERQCPTSFVQGAFPDTSAGYAAVASAALGLAADLGISGAAGAFRQLRADAPVMVSKFPEDPTFAIVPRTGDFRALPTPTP